MWHSCQPRSDRRTSLRLVRILGHKHARIVVVVVVVVVVAGGVNCRCWYRKKPTTVTQLSLLLVELGKKPRDIVDVCCLFPVLERPLDVVLVCSFCYWRKQDAEKVVTVVVERGTCMLKVQKKIHKLQKVMP